MPFHPNFCHLISSPHIPGLTSPPLPTNSSPILAIAATVSFIPPPTASTTPIPSAATAIKFAALNNTSLLAAGDPILLHITTTNDAETSNPISISFMYRNQYLNWSGSRISLTTPFLISRQTPSPEPSISGQTCHSTADHAAKRSRAATCASDDNEDEDEDGTVLRSSAESKVSWVSQSLISIFFLFHNYNSRSWNDESGLEILCKSFSLKFVLI